ELRAEAEIEGRRRLHPAAFEQQLGVAMEDEKVRTHLFGELRRGEVVLHIGEAYARGNATDSRACGEQRRLRHAPAFLALEARRAAVALVQHEVLERVVAHAVAHRVVKRNGALAIGRAGSMPVREIAHRGMVRVDEAARLEVLLHRSSFIRRRAPAKSALFWSTSPSRTEK